MRNCLLPPGMIAIVVTAISIGSAPAKPPATASVWTGADRSDAASLFHARLVPLVKKHCYECHGDGSGAGDLELDKFKSGADIAKATRTWEKVISYVRTHTMPPPEAESHPTQDEREMLVSAIQRQLYPIDSEKPDPGRVTIRRLNRTEYKNTIRDLVGVSFDPTLDFPEDDTGYGFDNIADVLTLPPMLMEKYLIAVEKILADAVPAAKVEPIERSVAATDATASFERSADHVRDGWVELSSAREDSLSVAHTSPASGEYVMRVQAYVKHDAPPIGIASPPPVVLSIMLGDSVVRDVEVTADQANPQWIETRIGVPDGRVVFRAALRRRRGIQADTVIKDKRIGPEQPGVVYVKEILVTGPVSGAVRRIGADRIELTGNGSGNPETGSVALHRTDDQAIANIDVPADGRYLLRTLACAEYAGSEHARIELSIDGKPLKTFDINAPAQRKPIARGELVQGGNRAVPQVYEAQADLKAGPHKLVARFVNNARDESNSNPNYRDRNVFLHHFEIVEMSAAPAPPPMTEPMRKLFAKHASRGGDDNRARALLADFSRRAWRRPAQPDELNRLMSLYAIAKDHGEDFRSSVKHAMKGILVSPSFLYRGELPMATNSAGSAYPISEHELASRLSYFLWSTMPDDELLKLADEGALRKNLHAQVRRMLKSPKSQALVENFAGQWLGFRTRDAAHPDDKQFEPYNDRLRDAMKRETQLFFESIVREDRSLLDVLTADYTFLNERLARHYNIPNVSGDEFRRVSLAGTSRVGVLTQGSVLTLTSNPTRTSPVKRGKWVMESILGTPPPPPPQNVPPLVEDGKKLSGTIRQKMEQHRADPSCASCHAALDPIGFGLENFDAIGRWREKDGDHKVDASSQLGTNGAKFNGPRELAEILARTRRNDFYRSVTESALTFALGRGVEPTDLPAVDTIISELRNGDGRFSKLVLGIVDSVPFQMRRDGVENLRQARTEVPRE